MRSERGSEGLRRAAMSACSAVSLTAEAAVAGQRPQTTAMTQLSNWRELTMENNLPTGRNNTAYSTDSFVLKAWQVE